MGYVKSDGNGGGMGEMRQRADGGWTMSGLGDDRALAYKYPNWNSYSEPTRENIRRNEANRLALAMSSQTTSGSQPSEARQGMEAATPSNYGQSEARARMKPTTESQQIDSQYQTMLARNQVAGKFVIDPVTGLPQEVPQYSMPAYDLDTVYRDGRTFYRGRAYDKTAAAAPGEAHNPITGNSTELNSQTRDITPGFWDAVTAPVTIPVRAGAGIIETLGRGIAAVVTSLPTLATTTGATTAEALTGQAGSTVGRNVAQAPSNLWDWISGKGTNEYFTSAGMPETASIFDRSSGGVARQNYAPDKARPNERVDYIPTEQGIMMPGQATTSLWDTLKGAFGQTVDNTRRPDTRTPETADILRSARMGTSTSRQPVRQPTRQPSQQPVRQPTGLPPQQRADIPRAQAISTPQRSGSMLPIPRPALAPIPVARLAPSADTEYGRSIIDTYEPSSAELDQVLSRQSPAWIGYPTTPASSAFSTPKSTPNTKIIPPVKPAALPIKPIASKPIAYRPLFTPLPALAPQRPVTDTVGLGPAPKLPFSKTTPTNTPRIATNTSAWDNWATSASDNDAAISALWQAQQTGQFQVPDVSVMQPGPSPIQQMAPQPRHPNTYVQTPQIYQQQPAPVVSVASYAGTTPAIPQTPTPLVACPGGAPRNAQGYCAGPLYTGAGNSTTANRYQ